MRSASVLAAASADAAGARAARRNPAPPRGDDSNRTAVASERLAVALGGSSVAGRIAELASLDLPALRAEWRRRYRRDPPRLSRDQMMRVLAYRIQEDAFGGLSQAVERRLAKLAAEFETEGRIATPAPRRVKTGARLVREWHGRTHVVGVVDGGFEYEGKIYPSLTAIAVEITGARWSGPRFFGLVRRKGAKESEHGGEAGQDGESPDIGQQAIAAEDAADV